MLRLNANPSVVILYTETLQVSESRKKIWSLDGNKKNDEKKRFRWERKKLNLAGLSFCHGKYLQWFRLEHNSEERTMTPSTKYARKFCFKISHTNVTLALFNSIFRLFFFLQWYRFSCNFHTNFFFVCYCLFAYIFIKRFFLFEIEKRKEKQSWKEHRSN